MPPASRGVLFNNLCNGLRIYGFRPNFCQRRLIARLPPKPSLPPASAIKTAIAQNVQRMQGPKVQETETKKGWKSFFSRLTLPPIARHFFPYISPPAVVRRWIWRLFFFGPPLAVFMMSFPLTIMRVQGASMAPFFNVNSSSELPATSPDIILVQKVQGLETLSNIIRLPKLKLERGQIVVFYAPHDPTKLAVKRVIGVPGDRVNPLPGYPGGDDQAVVIPYNHIWVEGDANSREKSMDSNYFGPMSQNMVFGFVLGVFTPWRWPVSLRWEEDDYPAKKSGRVETDIVKSAKVDPDEEARQGENPFGSGKAALELAMIRKNRDQLPRKLRDREIFENLRAEYALAKAELEKGDADTREVAEGLIEELEVAFESIGLNKDGSRLAPAVRMHGRVDEREEGATDKQRRLQEYIARQRAA